MNSASDSALARLLTRMVGHLRTELLLGWMAVPDPLLEGPGDRVSRAQMAMALNLLLFEDLLGRVPWAKAYVLDQAASGRKVLHDHGALRTVKTPVGGGLPPGQAAFSRILEPLGYALGEDYPLERLAMTGHAYRHQDLPEVLPQFFVSELHPERFSKPFQAAVAAVLATTQDPLPQGAMEQLEKLGTDGVLSLEQGFSLLPDLVACFGRHHADPALSDYETLLGESAEMAWIATEGNAFNHATDRVDDVASVAAAQRALGRPIKERVEISASGRVMQTAFRAAQVERVFVDADGQRLLRGVPGSFFEFITRQLEPGGGLDLHFDTSNAQGIFQMTMAERV